MPPLKRLAAAQPQRRILAVLAGLAAAACLVSPAEAEPQQALAILLRQLQAKPLGVYDGMRLFRIAQPAGGSLTLSVNCDREQWRVQNYDNPPGQSVFTQASLLPAKGIAHTWVCTTPIKGLE